MPWRRTELLAIEERVRRGEEALNYTIPEDVQALQRQALEACLTME